LEVLKGSIWIFLKPPKSKKMKTIQIVLFFSCIMFLIGCSTSDNAFSPCDTEVNSNYFLFKNPYELRIITENRVGGESRGGYILGSLEKKDNGIVELHIAGVYASEEIQDSAMQILHHPFLILKEDSTTLILTEKDIEIALVGSETCKQMLVDIHDWLLD
jgi:hypothetical protein